MRDLKTGTGGSCPCGTCGFDVAGPVKARIICHCTICQRFTGKALADVGIVPGWQASLDNEPQVTFRSYKKFGFPPPSLRRGRCKTCLQPFVETFGGPAMKILFIPAANFDDQAGLPRANAHVFYEHRQEDAEDDIPKHSGYLASQAAILRAVVNTL